MSMQRVFRKKSSSISIGLQSVYLYIWGGHTFLDAVAVSRIEESEYFFKSTEDHSSSVNMFHIDIEP